MSWLSGGESDFDGGEEGVVGGEARRSERGREGGREG